MQNKQYFFIEKKHCPEKSYLVNHFRKEVMPDYFKEINCNVWIPDP